MKAAGIILITFLIICLINWCRQDYFDESIFRVIPGMGGRELSIFDLAEIFCVGWVIYRMMRLKNKSDDD